MLDVNDYTARDALALTELVKSGEVAATEVVETAIDLAERINPAINAIAWKAYDAALSASRSADKDKVLGGVPTFIKDNDDVAGLPTGQGSRAMPTGQATANSGFVEQLLSTGLINLGKSALPEFGLTATTESLALGATRNPWNPGHIAGGSSGGSAALVSSGVVPIAHGNDGGGSIRIPAACCGLVGLKSTRGRLLSIAHIERLPINIVVQGVLTRTVRDTAAFFAEAEKYRRDPSLPELGLVAGIGKQRLRIAVFTEASDGRPSHPDVAAAVEEAAQHCANLGHHIAPISNPHDASVLRDFHLFWSIIPFLIKIIGKRELGRDFDKSKMEDWAHGLARKFRNNLPRFPFILRRLRKFAASYPSLFNDYDVLLSPILSQPPLRIGEIGPDVPFEIASERVNDYVSFTPYQNIAGAPAIALPIGRSQDGLPVGVQCAANFGADKMLLELAFELEEAAAWQKEMPPILSEALET
jgi:amidase